MSQIENLLSTVLVAEVTDVSSDICSIVNNAAIQDEFLSQEIIKLENQSNVMLTGIGTLRGKTLKDELDAADAHRDNLLAVLLLFLRAHIAWINSAGYNSASALMRIIKAHGNNIGRASLEKESALLESILTEFEKPENVQAIATLNLTQLVGELRLAQTQFKEVVKQSVTKESEKAENIAPTTKRRETIGQINLVINYLNVMDMARHEVFGNLTSELAILIEELNRKVRTRQSVQLAELTKAKTEKE